jgi:protoheme IX farnesyltransferase
MTLLSQLDTSASVRLRQLALVGTLAAGALAVLGTVADMRSVSQLGGAFLEIAPQGGVYIAAIVLVALLAIVTSLIGWRARSEQPQIVRLALITGALLVAHVLLGVLASSLGWFAFGSVVRLSTSLALVGALLTIALGSAKEEGPVKASQKLFRRSLITTAIIFYVGMLIGGFVTSMGATGACGSDFPFCNNALLPADPFSLAGLQQLHRLSVVVVAISLAMLVWKIVESRWNNSWLRVMTVVVAVAFIGQMLTGAAFIFLPASTPLAVLHQIFGTSAWAGLVALSLIAWNVPTAARPAQPEQGWKQTVNDFIKLTKPGVISLLLVTTVTTMYVAGNPSLSLVFWTLLAGYLSAGGANAINCFIDRDIDVLMGRTARRPIPSNRIDPVHALIFGIILGVLSFVIMAYFVNLLSAALSLFALLFYVVIYTGWLKRSSTQNIVIGGAAGAIPPMIGWTAMTGELSIFPLLLFLIVFYWTPPHFWALALIRRDDYARAGVPMLPVVEGDKETKKQILLYSIIMIVITLIPTFLGYLSWIYLASAVLLAVAHMRYVFNLMKDEANSIAWKMYRFTLIYLALLFCAMVLDAVLSRSAII